MRYHRNIRILQIENILFGCVFCLPVLIPFYKNQIGLTFQDFLIGEAVFAAVVVALEIPSGWLSDIWKRKHVLTMAFAFWVLGFGVLLISNSLLPTLIAQAILGISISLRSGTDISLLYDTLLDEKQEREFTKLEGRRFGFGFYALAITSTIGALIYSYNPYMPIILSMVCGIFGIICALLLKEPSRHKSPVEKHPVHDMLVTIRYALSGHVVVGIIIALSALLFSSTKIIMWSQQPYYIELGIPIEYFGILMACGFGLAGFASQFSHFLSKHLSNFAIFVMVWLYVITICVLCAYSMSYFGVILLMFGGSFIFGAASPCIADAINKRVESDRRATILSTASFSRELLFIPLSLVAGWISASYGIQGVFYSLALWLAIIAPFVGLWGLKRLRTSSQ